MSEHHNALVAAGVPVEHAEQVHALGITPAQAKELAARGIDWKKFLGNLPALITLIMSMFGGKTA